MTAPVDFQDIQQLEVAFRALVTFKFSGDVEADVFFGSPIMAGALERMLAAIEAIHRAQDNEARANSWRDMYTLSRAGSRRGIVAEYYHSLPRLSEMSLTDRVDWLRVCSSPYRFDVATDLESLLGA